MGDPYCECGHPRSLHSAYGCPCCGCPEFAPPRELRGTPAWVLAVLLLAALALLAWVGLASGAPAPVYREPPPLANRVVGTWRLAWGSSEGTCTLSAGGGWRATLGALTWHGRWSLEGSTLTVRERRASDPEASETTWAIALDGRARVGASGTVAGGTAFAMRR